MRFRIFFPIFRLSKHIDYFTILLHSNSISHESGFYFLFKRKVEMSPSIFSPFFFHLIIITHYYKTIFSFKSTTTTVNNNKKMCFFSFIRKFLERHSCPKNDNTFLYYYESESLKKPFIRKLYF